MNYSDPRVITAHPSRLPLVSLAATILVLILVIAGSLGALLLQKPLQQASVAEVRSQAAVSNGSVILGTSPTNNSNLTINQPAKIDVTLNTQSTVAKQIELVFFVNTLTADSINLQTYSTYNLVVSKQEVQQVTNGFLVSFTAQPANNGTFVSTSAQPVLSILFTPNKTGTFKIIFDTSKSKILAADNTTDELRTIGTLEYIVQKNTTTTTKSCNDTCSSSSECAINDMCYQGRCRLVTNVNSETCQSSGAAATTATHQCNGSCSSNSDCKSGLTCFENQCRQPDNPDSTSCVHSDAVQQAAMAQNCNQYCTDNRGCANNFRCFNNACRLATNPSSTSCSPLTAPTVTNQYYSDGSTVTHTKGEEVPSPTPSPVVEPSASPASSSAYFYSPYPSFSPYAAPSPVAETPSNGIGQMINGWFSQFSSVANSFNSSSLLLVAAGAGLLLLILAVIMLIVRRGSRGSSSPVTKKTTSNSTYEQELQAKISQLQNQTAAPAPTAAQPAPIKLPPAQQAAAETNIMTPPPSTLRPTSGPVAQITAPPPNSMYSRPSSTRPMTLAPATTPVAPRTSMAPRTGSPVIQPRPQLQTAPRPLSPPPAAMQPMPIRLPPANPVLQSPTPIATSGVIKPSANLASGTPRAALPAAPAELKLPAPPTSPASTSAAAFTTPSATPKPVTQQPTPVRLPPAQSSVLSSIMSRPAAQPQPRPVVASAAPAAQASSSPTIASPSRSSMMDRLKQRGVQTPKTA